MDRARQVFASRARDQRRPGDPAVRDRPRDARRRDQHDAAGAGDSGELRFQCRRVTERRAQGAARHDRHVRCQRVGEQTANPDASAIRKQLIQTYMYFLSAPFLAVAVYYLLQVIASSVAEPVLVVIAFASGLMSNAAVGAIMAFADNVLEKARQPKAAAGNPVAY